MAVIENSRRILYIGSDTKVFNMLFDTLDKEIDVYHVETPALGYTWLGSQDVLPALVLLEKDTKGIAPYAFSNLLKNKFGNNRLKVALVVDDLMSCKISDALENGIVEIFRKPFSKQQKNRMISLIKSNYNLQVNQGLSNKIYSGIPLWKRTFDILFALTALILLSPLLLIVIILIKLDSEGPILYAAKRAGKNYKIFNFYKFRTMRIGADKELDDLKKELNQYSLGDDQLEYMTFECNGCIDSKCAKLAIDNRIVCEKQYVELYKDSNTTFVKLKNDPRVTKVGRLLRNTSIDELPQLLNILKGDMSVVGNRPLPLYEAEELTTDKSSQRFYAPAGLTGLWQVQKRGKKNMSDEERKTLDNEYAENYSFWMDVKLIFQTLGVFIQKENV
ncbi:MAG: sugar transferase [Saprospiraceae bacterium]|nr:sugar transferase [Saprospiraceae bacterium]